MQKIKFSVLIPVYNVEKFIMECIESVLSQTYQNFEIILINDGSTDSSGIMCEEYAAKDNRIKTYNQKNQGLIMARRKAIAKASGDFCLFLDSDDYWESNLLEMINQKICEYNCDLVIFKYKRVSEKGDFLSEAPFVFNDNMIFDSENKEVIFKEIIGGSNLNNLVCKAVKRSIIDNTDYSQYSKIKNAEDLLQSLPLLYKAEKIVYIGTAFYNYRVVENSITQKFDVNLLRDVTIVREDLLKYLKRLKLDNENNIRAFYTFYMNVALSYIAKLVNSDISKRNKISIIREFQDSPLYKESLNKTNLSKFTLEQKVLFYLLSKNYYRSIFLYGKTFKALRGIKRFI
jgi:glycosyltransferase involved in cell wall biosynthesis